jgi:hypothetical protein
MEKETKDKIRKYIVYSLLVVFVIVLVFYTTILMFVYFDSDHGFVKGYQYLKPITKFILPVILITWTIYVAFVTARILGDRFDNWITWETFEKKT